MVAADRAFEGTTAQWYVFADFVRLALHAAVEQIEPQDGLEPIRARIPADQALPVAQDVRAAGLLTQDVGAAFLSVENVGAAFLSAENVGAASFFAEDVRAAIRCHQVSFRTGFSHSLHHRGPAFIAPPRRASRVIPGGAARTVRHKL